MESVVHFRQKLDNEMRAVNPHRVSGILNHFWTLIIYTLCKYGFLGLAHDRAALVMKVLCNPDGAQLCMVFDIINV